MSGLFREVDMKDWVLFDVMFTLIGSEDLRMTQVLAPSEEEAKKMAASQGMTVLQIRPFKTEGGRS